MRSYDDIHAIAAGRKGGPDALDAMLAGAGPVGDLAASRDDRWLATMARCIFQAGFSWTVIEAKWPGFEAAFHGFDPARVSFYHDEDLDRLLGDTGIVRNGAKINAVIENARFVAALAQDHTSAGAFFAAWSVDDTAGLLRLMAKRGARLGGMTGQRALRDMGYDSYLLSNDVVARLIAEGVIDKPPTSQRAMTAVQTAFNTWRAESGRSQVEISRTLAYSVG